MRPGLADINENCLDPDQEGPLLRGDGQFSSPHGIALHEDLVYVSDSFNNRIQGIKPLLLPEPRLDDPPEDDPPEDKKKKEKTTAERNKETQRQLNLVWIKEREFSQLEQTALYEILKQPLEKKPIGERLLELVLSIGEKPIKFSEELLPILIKNDEPRKIPSPFENEQEEELIQNIMESKEEDAQVIERNDDDETTGILTALLIIIPLAGFLIGIKKIRSRHESPLSNRRT